MKPGHLFLSAALAITFAAGSAAAVSCEDFDDCTANDMCADGMCVGTPLNGGSCDDGNDCTVNDTCVAGTCTGTPAAAGTSCNQGCGSCFSQFGFTFCMPDDEEESRSCDDGIACTDNDRCQFGFCFGDLKECADADGDPCTLDFCNPLTGACVATEVPPCNDCSSCVPDSGGELPFRCEPANQGATCDDFNECTADGTCVQGDCVDAPPVGTGAPTRTASATPTQSPANTATPTATSPPANTATPTATQAPANTATPTRPAGATHTATQVPVNTATPTQPAGTTPTATVPASGCSGDCNGDGEVTVDEIVTGVNIALGSLPMGNCLAMDTNGDGEVTVDELLKAINAALNGCV
jgi:hypothetical protein